MSNGASKGSSLRFLGAPIPFHKIDFLIQALLLCEKYTREGKKCCTVKCGADCVQAVGSSLFLGAKAPLQIATVSKSVSGQKVKLAKILCLPERSVLQTCKLALTLYLQN